MRAELPYMPQLDGVRCLAVMAVLITHFGGQELINAAGLGGGLFGITGIFIFFVLSGFLITGILLRLREDSPNVGAARQFYKRRALRILPLYYATLLLGVLLAVPGVRGRLIWHLFYVSNFARALLRDGLGAVGHFWTLAVEEQFYLGWPWAVLFLRQRNLLKLILAGIGVGVCSRIVLVQLTGDNEPTDPYVWLNVTTSVLDPLALGALLAYCRHYQRHLTWLRACARFGALGCLPILLLSPFAKLGLPVVDYSLGWLVVELGFVWLVDRAADGRAWPLLGWAPIRYLGKISYGIYMLHLPVMWFARPLVGEKPSVWRFIVLTALSIAAAALSWHLFEAPINALKRRIPYAGRAPGSTDLRRTGHKPAGPVAEQ
jgi:peptidoglycan/LPS O-acetylase OafA/YrhL